MGSDTGEFVVRLSLSTGVGTLLVERVVLVESPTSISPADDLPDDTASTGTGDAGSPTSNATSNQTAPTTASSDEADAVLPAGGLCGTMGMVEMLTLCLSLGLISRTHLYRRHRKA